MDQKPGVKIEPEDKKTGKTRSQPRFKIALGLAVALLLVTCAVAAGGLMTYFRGKCQHKRGLSVLYQRGNCYLLEDKYNVQSSEFDIDEVEAAMESLTDASDVPSFDVDQVIFLNRSVPVSPEDDVILRSQLPPVCRDVTLYRVQEENARDYLQQKNDDGKGTETSHNRVRRSFEVCTESGGCMFCTGGIRIRFVYAGRCFRSWWRPYACRCAFQCKRKCRCYKMEISCGGGEFSG